VGVWFVRALTAIHAIGSLVLAGIVVFHFAGGVDAVTFARTPGARLMIGALGPWVPVFLAVLALFLASMAWASHRRRPWAWRAAVAAYTFGILGSLWEASTGAWQAWLSVLVNAGVVTLLWSRPTRRAYFPQSREP
jgi:hypothetical protein